MGKDLLAAGTEMIQSPECGRIEDSVLKLTMEVKRTWITSDLESERMFLSHALTHGVSVMTLGLAQCFHCACEPSSETILRVAEVC